METIPQELIEKALALTGKTMDDMCIYSDFWEDFSKEYFCYYLLSPEFIEKYKENVPMAMWNNHWVCYIIWDIIYEYQKWNAQPLIGLLSKI